MRVQSLILLVLLAVGYSLPATVQAQKKEMKQAEKYFNSFEYALALDAYKKVLEQEEPNPYTLQRIADSHRLMNNSKEAEFWYAQLAGFPDASPASLYYYAEAAKRNGNYTKAKELFLKYGSRVPEKADLAQALAASCDTAMHWMKTPKSYKLEEEERLNSAGVDFSPVKMPNGGMIFSSDRLQAPEAAKKKERFNWTGNGYVQLYFAPLDTASTWGAPVPLTKEINTDYHNGPASYLEQEGMLFFTRTNSVRQGRKKKTTDPTSWVGGANDNRAYINRLEIYTAKRDNDSWSNIKPFAYNRPQEFSVGHPAVTPDGRLLYFVSDMPGGMGETDIYYSERQSDGSWGAPVNAGSSINTSGRESFPAIGADGKLYFSSDGHLGMGGLDIFVAEGAGKEWTSLQNLRYPLNSSHDDLGIAMDSSGTKGWLSSGRGSDKGFDNIYSFKEVPVECVLVGETIELVAQPGTHLKKKVKVENVLLQLFEENVGTLAESHSDSLGNFRYGVQAGMQYTVRGSKKGYLTQTILFTPNCQYSIDSLLVEMVLIRDTPNVPIVLENIFYDLDKHDIRPDAALELDKLVRILKDNPGIRIELSSHTDSRQTQQYNQSLSERRAKAAVNYLISKGIDRKRLVAKGYGETQLRNKCGDNVDCSEEEHQVNRRTEFKIIGK